MIVPGWLADILSEPLSFQPECKLQRCNHANCMFYTQQNNGALWENTLQNTSVFWYSQVYIPCCTVCSSAVKVGLWRASRSRDHVCPTERESVEDYGWVKISWTVLAYDEEIRRVYEGVEWISAVWNVSWIFLSSLNILVRNTTIGFEICIVYLINVCRRMHRGRQEYESTTTGLPSWPVWEKFLVSFW